MVCGRQGIRPSSEGSGKQSTSCRVSYPAAGLQRGRRYHDHPAGPSDHFCRGRHNWQDLGLVTLQLKTTQQTRSRMAFRLGNCTTSASLSVCHCRTKSFFAASPLSRGDGELSTGLGLRQGSWRSNPGRNIQAGVRRLGPNAPHARHQSPTVPQFRVADREPEGTVACVPGRYCNLDAATMPAGPVTTLETLEITTTQIPMKSEDHRTGRWTSCLALNVHRICNVDGPSSVVSSPVSS